MALSQADLDRLDRAIATSELEVEVDGDRRRFRSISELMTARAHVAQVLATQPGAGRTAGATMVFTPVAQRDY